MRRFDGNPNRRDVLKKFGLTAGTGVGFGSSDMVGVTKAQSSNGFNFSPQEAWDALLNIAQNKLGGALSVQYVEQLIQDIDRQSQINTASQYGNVDGQAFKSDLQTALQEDLNNQGEITADGQVVQTVLGGLIPNFFSTDLPVSVCYKPTYQSKGICLDALRDIYRECNGNQLWTLPFKIVSVDREFQGWWFTWKVDFKTESWLGWDENGCLYAGVSAPGSEQCSRVMCYNAPRVRPVDSVSTIVARAFNFAENVMRNLDRHNSGTIIYVIAALLIAFAIMLFLPELAAGAAAAGVVLGAGAVAIAVARQWS